MRSSLVNSSLREASLNHADLCSADLSDADVWNAKLADANLSGANLQGVRNLTQEQLDEACGSVDTKLPNGLLIGECSKIASNTWVERGTESCRRVEGPERPI